VEVEAAVGAMCVRGADLFTYIGMGRSVKADRFADLQARFGPTDKISEICKESSRSGARKRHDRDND
jgi:hypothetical protein